MDVQRSRQLEGSTVFDRDSDACCSALQQLWDILSDIGFKLSRKSPRESTLRVYPTEYHRYPLLNPRFEPAETHGIEYLDFTVLSRGNAVRLATLDRQLETFVSTRACRYLPLKRMTTRFYYHGKFLLPLRFVGTVPYQKIAFSDLRKPLCGLFRFLTHVAADG